MKLILRLSLKEVFGEREGCFTHQSPKSSHRYNQTEAVIINSTAPGNVSTGHMFTVLGQEHVKGQYSIYYNLQVSPIKLSVA